MIYSQIPLELMSVVESELTFEIEQYNPFARRKVKREINMINSRGIFLSGFENRIAKLTGFQFNNFHRFKFYPPKFNDIILNSPQKRCLKQVLNSNRGVIVAPTGMGKTIIACGMISMYRDYKILFLCHKIDLIYQTQKEIKEKLSIDCNIIGDGSNIDNSSNITVATIQTAKKHIKQLKNTDIIIVDECHHVNKKKSDYWNFLTAIDSPKKYGLTATLPTDKQKAMILEGLIGEVISEITFDEGIQEGRLCPVKIRMIDIKSEPKKNWKWVQHYQKMIVENAERNLLISDIIIKKWQAKKSCLIMVKTIEHGVNLEQIISKSDIPVVFLSGKDSSDKRLEYKQKLQSKQVVLIVTNIFDEGINIPSLDCIINAAGGKSDIATLQKVGRGIRTSEGKQFVTIVDFRDNGKYLKEHSKQRYFIYQKMGWV